MVHNLLTVGLTSFAAIVACMLLLWLLAVAIKDVSIVDIFWGPGFAVIAWVAYWLGDGAPERKLLLTALVTIWALRLGLTLLARKLRHGGEDLRYTAMRKKVTGNFNLFALRMVFALQAVLLWLISLPVQVGQVYATPVALGPLAYIGAALWLIGFAFEAVGDWQMDRFKANPANAGKVMDRGLWRYTRHPNYFGDALLWWGLGLIACENLVGVPALIGPAIITWLLVRVSGKALLERRLRRAKPDYARYIERTPGLVPWWPKGGLD